MDTIWTYLLLIFLIAIEGEIAILVGAGAASAGFLNLPAVFAVAVLGNLISDILWYLLGYYGKIDWLLYRMKWIGITPQKLSLMIDRIQQDAIKLLVFAKLTNWMTIPALIATGVARVSWRRWFLLILFSNILVAAVMVPLGYYMTSSLLQIQKGVSYAAFAFTLLFVIVAIFYIRHHLICKDSYTVLEDKELTE